MFLRSVAQSPPRKRVANMSQSNSKYQWERKAMGLQYYIRVSFLKVVSLKPVSLNLKALSTLRLELQINISISGKVRSMYAEHACSRTEQMPFPNHKKALKKGQFMTVRPPYAFLCFPPLGHILLLIHKPLKILSKHLCNYWLSLHTESSHPLDTAVLMKISLWAPDSSFLRNTGHTFHSTIISICK